MVLYKFNTKKCYLGWLSIHQQLYQVGYEVYVVAFNKQSRSNLDFKLKERVLCQKNYHSNLMFPSFKLLHLAKLSPVTF